MLTRRQIDVQYRNLASMCRLTVKCLIDSACVNTHVDEDCEEFLNFCAVFEQMVGHRLKPYQKKVWQRNKALPRHFWEVMVENNRQGALFRTCIPNIEAIESIKSPIAKLRAFVRVALMEKRLSDYLYWMLNNSSLMEECYLEGALFSSDEGFELIGDIIGLSAIDFNFCLRGTEKDLLGPLEISYVPFLQYTQSSASRLIDQEEMLVLSGQRVDKSNTTGQTITEDKLKLDSLQRDFRGVKEQKDYLEELVRLRERQMGEAKMRLDKVKESMHAKESEWETDRRMLNTCVLELQDEITNLVQQNSLLKAQVSDLQLFKSRLEYRDVQMVDMAYIRPALSSAAEGGLRHDGAQQTEDVPRVPSFPLLSESGHTSQGPSADQRSILSSVSDQLRLQEDSQSLIPLTGSLADVNVALLKQADESKSERKKGFASYSVNRGGTNDGTGDVELTLFQSDSTETKSSPEGDVAVASETPSSSATSTKAKTAIEVEDVRGQIANTGLEDSYVLADTRAEFEVADEDKSGTVVGEGERSTGIERTDADGKCDQEREVTRKVEGSSSSSSSFSHLNRQEEEEEKVGECGDNTDTITRALQDLGQAFETGDRVVERGDPIQVATSSQRDGDGSVVNDGDGVNAPRLDDPSQRPEEEDANSSSSTSDPETQDRVNTNSDGSDAAWELLSDAEDTDK